MSGSLRILLVDDDSVDRATVTRALKSLGINAKITEAEDGMAALEVLGRTPAGFDLGIFDLHLPGRDGLELLSDVRAAGIDMPVIFLTGQGSEEIAAKLMKSGAADYLSKNSLSAMRLLQCIDQTMRLAKIERAQRETERMLVLSEAGFRRLAENLPDAIVRFDSAGRQAYANQAAPWSQMSTASEMLGLTISQSSSDVSLTEPLEGALRHALGGEPAQVTLALSKRGPEPESHGKHGTLAGPVLRWFEVRFVPEPATLVVSSDPPTQVASVLAIARDVTAEVLRQEAEHRHAEFERQLIGIVSHDLRGPIGAILLGVSLLKRKLDDSGDDSLMRTLDVLDRSGERAKRMVSDILDFTKARLGGGIPMSFADCDLAAVARELVDELRTAHPSRSIELSVEGSMQGTFDADRIGQAMGNLLINAITYSAPTELVTIQLVARATELRIAVSNHGPTIAPEVLPMLFKPFQRGSSRVSDHNASRSVGLGLFIVDEIVRGHRGRIEVVSKDGLTVFTIALPRCAPVSAIPGVVR